MLDKQVPAITLLMLLIPSSIAAILYRIAGA